MVGYFLRRIFAIPVILLLAHFVGYSFAHVTFQLQLSQTVYGSGRDGFTPIWPEYENYMRGVLEGNFGNMPAGINEPITANIFKALKSSLFLILVAYGLSVLVGLILGLAAVQVDPPRSLPWLTWLSTVGLAMPSFIIGVILVGGVLWLSNRTGLDPVLPVAGFGLDVHLILPVIALSIRPGMQVAQVTANLLANQLGLRYVMAARSFGYTWRAIRWDKALRNVLAPVILTMAGSFRLLMGELLLVEWLFNWPGLGRMLVQTLVPPSLSSIGGLIDTSAFFLNAPLVAGLLVVFAFFFLIADIVSTGLVRIVDPRLRVVEEAVSHD